MRKRVNIDMVEQLMKKILILLLCFSMAALVNIPLGMAQEEDDSSAQNVITELLSESGRIIPDVESNSIMVMDLPYNISMVEDYLTMADMPSQQVLIEARVVEVKLEKQHTHGVNWSALTQDFRMGDSYPQGNSAGVEYVGLWQQIPTRSIQWEPIKGTDQNSWSVGVFNDHIDGLIEMLTTQLTTDIISAPKITTTNNRRAKIDVVKTTPYLAEVEMEEEEMEGGGLRVTYTYNYEYADEGVNMEVIPLVNPDETITMTIVPQVKEIVRWIEMVAPEGASKEPELPETDVRITQTKVTVQQGQTLVIGGLIREKKTEGITKVPFFGDIPLFGALFRNKIETTDKTELLILVSPTIVNSKVIKDMHDEGRDLSKWYIDEKLAEEKKRAKVEKTEKKRMASKLHSLEKKVQKLVDRRKDFEKQISE